MIYGWGWWNLQMQNCGYGGLTMGLEHPQISVSVLGPGTNPLWIPRDDCMAFIMLRYVPSISNLLRVFIMKRMDFVY